MAAKTRTIQTNWTNGVLSPRVLGRVEMDKYYNSAEVIRDMIILPQGGLKRRPGLQYVADAMGPSRLIPFIFSPGVAYILEFGNKTLRIHYAYNDKAQSPSGTFQPKYTVGQQIQSGGSPLQLTTPYDTSLISLWDIQYAQQGDIMYLTHPLYPIQKLMRFGASGTVPGPTDTNWRLIAPTLKTPPTDEFDQDVSGGTITVTPGALTGSGVTFTASASVFLAGDVGKFIVADTQVAYITAYVSGTQVTCNILDPFTSVAAIAAGSWKLRGSPNAWACYGHLDGSTPPNFFADKSFGVGSSVDLFTYKNFPSDTKNQPATVACFRTTDVGRYVNCAGSIGLVTAFVNSNRVTVQFLSVPESTFLGGESGNITKVAPAAPGAWSLEDPIWSGTNGYPACVAFFEDRLLLAATQQQPKTVWGSVIGDYENFAKGTKDDDALDFTISGGKLDTVQWMAPTPVQGKLAIETDGGEYVASATGGKDALTPTSGSVQPNSAQGGSKIMPILVDSALIYLQRYHTKLYEFSFNIYQSSFASKDLSQFAEHLMHSGVRDMAFQPQPYKILWMVTFDGRLLGMTYDRTQEVCGLHEHRTGYADNGYGAVGSGDSFISVAVIPNPSTVLLGADGTPIYRGNMDPSYTSDLVWTVVKRTRNGATVYTIEMMSEDLMADSVGLTPTLVSSTQVQDSHLAGRVVVATGLPVNSQKNYFPFDAKLAAPAVADASGNLTLTVPAQSITAYGLPFQPTLQTVRPEIRGGGPTIQGKLQRFSEIWLRLYQTLGATVGGKVQNFRGLPGVLPDTTAAASLEPGVVKPANYDTMTDEFAPLTVDIRVHQIGYDRFGRVLVTQPDPYPITLLAMYGELNIGDQ